MKPFCRRAVAAAAEPEEARALTAMLRSFDFSEIIEVFDGRSALCEVQRKPTDVLIADAILPVLDGASLVRRVDKLFLSVYPATVLRTLPGMNVMGADAVLTKPTNAEALKAALESVQPFHRTVPEEKRRRAESILDALGIPDHPGRQCLLRAAELAWMDSRLLQARTAVLYPAAGEMLGLSGRGAERAIRRVIDVAWNGGEMDAQYKIFGDTIDAKRGSPTCGEMIARLADILRREG